jgi:hypothetical protein
MSADPSFSGVSRRALLSTLAVAPVLPGFEFTTAAQAQLPVQLPRAQTQLPESAGFSFAACVLAIQGGPAGPCKFLRRNVRPRHAGERCCRAGAEGCEDDLRSCHQKRRHQDHHAVRFSQRSYDIVSRPRLGHRGVSRGLEADSGVNTTMFRLQGGDWWREKL